MITQRVPETRSRHARRVQGHESLAERTDLILKDPAGHAAWDREGLFEQARKLIPPTPAGIHILGCLRDLLRDDRDLDAGQRRARTRKSRVVVAVIAGLEQRANQHVDGDTFLTSAR